MANLGEPRTTDYCPRCRQSPESASHVTGNCQYLDPRPLRDIQQQLNAAAHEVDDAHAQLVDAQRAVAQKLDALRVTQERVLTLRRTEASLEAEIEK